jgi:hypothetical protein
MSRVFARIAAARIEAMGNVAKPINEKAGAISPARLEHV